MICQCASSVLQAIALPSISVAAYQHSFVLHEMLPVFVLYPWLPVASNSECLGQKFVTPEVTAKNILIACGGRPSYGDYPGVKDWNRQPEAVSLSHNVARI